MARVNTAAVPEVKAWQSCKRAHASRMQNVDPFYSESTTQDIEMILTGKNKRKQAKLTHQEKVRIRALRQLSLA